MYMQRSYSICFITIIFFSISLHSNSTAADTIYYYVVYRSLYIYTRIFMIRSYLRGVYPNCRRRRMSRLQRQRRYKVGKKQT